MNEGVFQWGSKGVPVNLLQAHECLHSFLRFRLDDQVHDVELHLFALQEWHVFSPCESTLNIQG